MVEREGQQGREGGREIGREGECVCVCVCVHVPLCIFSHYVLWHISSNNILDIETDVCKILPNSREFLIVL